MEVKGAADKTTFWATLAVLGGAGAVNGYKAARFRLGGKRIETIKVAKIHADKTAGRSTKLKLANNVLLKAELLNIPIGSVEKFILEDHEGRCFVITTGALHLKNVMKPGKTYECEVIGDPNWGVPRITRMIKEVVLEEVVPEENLDDSETSVEESDLDE